MHQPTGSTGDNADATPCHEQTRLCCLRHQSRAVTVGCTGLLRARVARTRCATTLVLTVGGSSGSD